MLNEHRKLMMWPVAKLERVVSSKNNAFAFLMVTCLLYWPTPVQKTGGQPQGKTSRKATDQAPAALMSLCASLR